ncbi:MAG: hypothetical protein QM765_36375 [Myxococcales bacterium]
MPRVSESSSQGVAAFENDAAQAAAPAPKPAHAAAPPPAAKDDGTAEGSKDVFERAPSNSTGSVFSEPRKQPGALTRSTNASASTPDTAYAAIEKKLSYGALDWRVSQGEAKEVTQLLAKLPPDQLRATIERMDRDGLMERYLSKLGFEERKQLLDLTVSAGLTKLEPGQVGVGTAAPPDKPALYRNDESLPAGLREAVRTQNRSLAERYFADYSRYVDRFATQVGQAPSAQAIRSMGSPQGPLLKSWDRSQLVTHPDHASYKPIASEAQLCSTNRAYVAVSKRMHELTGTVRPGSFWLEGSVDVKGKISERLEGGFKVEGKVYDSGQTKTKGTGSGSIVLGADKVTGSYGSEGWKVESSTKDKIPYVDELGAPKNLPIAFKVADGEKGREVSATVGPADVKIKESGAMEFGWMATENVGGYSKVDPDAAELTGGVKAKGKLGKVEIEAKAGVGYKGITAKEVAKAIDPKSVGFFASPPELAQKTPWSELSPERRKVFENQHWTEAEWDARLAQGK